jgi:beta-lactamase regulating signal transducer with metallopeptidase domain
MMERALAEYMVNALWQVPFLAGVAWLLVRVLMPGPQTQHRVWLAVLGLAVVLPAYGMGRTGVPAKQPQQTIAVTQERVASREDPLTGLTRNEVRSALKHRFEFPFYPQMHTIRLTATVAHWLARLYMATVVFGLLRIARAWRTTMDLVVHSRETSQHRAELAEYSRRLGVRLPQLRESGEVSSPMVVGVAMPVVLLPENFVRFTEEEVEAALCHELAHIKRRDYLMNVLCQMATLPLVWHPVVYGVQQRIRVTREMVCDAMAAQEMKSHIGYAKCLLALAHSMLGGRDTAGRAQSLGLFSNNTVEERVMRLMETTTMSVRTRVARVASAAVVMIAAGAMAAMFHVTPTMAESQAVAPPQVGQAAPSASPTQPVASEPKPSSSPLVAEPTDKARTERSIHRNRSNREHPEPNRAEQELIDKNLRQEIEDAQQQMPKVHVMIDSPEFRQQMEDAQRQTAKVRMMLDSPEFKLQMEDAKRKMAETTAKTNSPEFKQQMEDAQRQMAKARMMLDSSEFKQQMEDAKRKMAETTAKMNSPEFKQQMEDLKRQMAESTAKMNNPEFKHQMEDLKRQMAETTAKMNSPEFKQQMENAQRQMLKSRTMLDGAEFKHQMDDLQKHFQNEEFQQRMNEDSLRPQEAPSQTGNAPIN